MPFLSRKFLKYTAQVYSGNLLLQSTLFCPLSTPKVPRISATGANRLVYIYNLSPVPFAPVVQSYLNSIHEALG